MRINRGFGSILVILIILILAVVAYLAYKNNPRLKSYVETITQKTITNGEDIVVYQSQKYGFSIKYNKNLRVVPHETDLSPASYEYQRWCRNRDCGGGPWPSFVISFIRPNGKIAFEVWIYQLADEYFGKVNDGFTYSVTIFELGHAYWAREHDPVDQSVADEIMSTLEFIKKSKPKECLWSGVKNGYTDAVSIKRWGDSLVPISGFYFDHIKNSCDGVLYFVWNDLKNVNYPPFETLDECIRLCAD